MNLQEKILQATRLATEFTTVFRFQHNGVFSYAYPNETPSTVEKRWLMQAWLDITEHWL